MPWEQDRYGVESVVFASAFGVYGDPEAYPPGPLAHDAPLLPRRKRVMGEMKLPTESMTVIHVFIAGEKAL